MFNSDDLPTRPYPALAPEPTQIAIALPEFLGNLEHGVPLEELPIEEPTLEDVEPPTRVLSIALPVSAQKAFEEFCDSSRVHEWMAVVRSSRVIARASCGRPQSTAFIARLERSSMGYTMHYEYDDATRTVRWCNSSESSTRISGTAQFTHVGPTRSMMHYELDVDTDNELPAWGDPMYNGHPASSVLSDFRDYLSRNWG